MINADDRTLNAELRTTGLDSALVEREKGKRSKEGHGHEPGLCTRGESGIGIVTVHETNAISSGMRGVSTFSSGNIWRRRQEQPPKNGPDRVP